MNLPNRRSIRLKGYDYSHPGLYFVTACTKDREHVFGEVINEKMILNEFGKIVNDEWYSSANIRDEIFLDEFIIMPNHIHGIIGIHANNISSYGRMAIRPNEFQSPSKNLGSMIRAFKGSTTKKINITRNTPSKPVWQRNYYEHIIRNESALNRIRKYIRNNPRKWDEDRNNK